MDVLSGELDAGLQNFALNVNGAADFDVHGEKMSKLQVTGQLFRSTLGGSIGHKSMIR